MLVEVKGRVWLLGFVWFLVNCVALVLLVLLLDEPKFNPICVEFLTVAVLFPCIVVFVDWLWVGGGVGTPNIQPKKSTLF